MFRGWCGILSDPVPDGLEPKPSLAFVSSLNFREVWIHIGTVQLPPISNTNQTKTPHPNSSEILGHSSLDPNIAMWAHLYCSPSVNGKGRMVVAMSITSAYGKCLWRPTALVLKFGAAHVCKQSPGRILGKQKHFEGNAVSVSGLSTKGHCWLLLPRQQCTVRGNME
ncbi:hypothetical protein KIL84_015829 [Mauremys mutica]|uniref:Uncharacterized protein n=1 Tax=Mauremys mutica TaxID=74926 RepID=A0A9D3WRA2_9SAUR|nr:hypothetical protein KIL84_015829 [Mauremys mutica]